MEIETKNQRRKKRDWKQSLFFDIKKKKNREVNRHNRIKNGFYCVICIYFTKFKD